MRRTRRGITATALVLAAGLAAAATPEQGKRTRRKELEDGRVETSGLIVPAEGEALALRSLDGETRVRWTPRTKVVLSVNFRQLGNIRDGALQYQIQWEGQTVAIPLPRGPAFARKSVQPRRVKAALAEALAEKWLVARGVSIHATPLADHLATEAEPFFAGKWTFGGGRGKPPTLTVGDTAFEVSMKKGGQTHVLLYDVFEPQDCTPFVNRATVIGKEAGGALVADEIHLLPIGDSISYNYAKALRAGLQGKANVHHPPTNCGPSGKGAGNIVEWLGAHEVRGRHWDAVSFNFGHWDADNTKAQYQSNLEFVVAHLEKTGAKLIWVTTCPVPEGFPPAGDLTPEGKAPRRTAGVMRKYLNPWAAEVMARHPAVAVCDQWQLVKDNRDGLYTEWWKGKNVHFGGDGADALGSLLADAVLRALGSKGKR